MGGESTKLTRRNLIKRAGRVAVRVAAYKAMEEYGFAVIAKDQLEGPRKKRVPFPPRGKASYVHVTARSNAMVGKGIEVNVAFLDEIGAKASGYRSTVELRNDKGEVLARHNFRPEDDATYRFKDIPISSPGVTRFAALDAGNKSLRGESNPVLVTQNKPELNTYWGDPHWHTMCSQDVSEYDATLDHGLMYSREVANLDFTIPTDHDGLAYPQNDRGTPPFNEETWREYVSTVNRHNTPELHAKIIGTAPISKVEVVKFSLGSTPPFPSTCVVEECTDECEFWWTDKEFGQDAAYYLRITQEDGEMVWASPIWVNNGNGVSAKA